MRLDHAKAQCHRAHGFLHTFTTAVLDVSNGNLLVARSGRPTATLRYHYARNFPSYGAKPTCARHRAREDYIDAIRYGPVKQDQEKTKTAPTPPNLKRLAFARLLFEQGIEQSNRPEPLNVSAVLTFHDAAEHFLILAGEHLGGLANTRPNFLDYWKEIKKSHGMDLAGYIGMDRLNRLRTAFKHVGTIPSSAQVEQARIDSSSFF